MLKRILKPYHVIVSAKARAAGFEDQSFPNRRSVKRFVKMVRNVDPDFRPSSRLLFRYYDSATGELFATRADYETEQDRLSRLRGDVSVPDNFFCPDC